jgi:hypothetical protein
LNDLTKNLSSPRHQGHQASQKTKTSGFLGALGALVIAVEILTTNGKHPFEGRSK